MGAVDKFLNKLNIGNPSTDDEYYDDYEDDDYEEQPIKKIAKAKDSEDSIKRFSKVTSIGNKKKPSGNEKYEINVVKPESIDNSREITDGLLAGKAVLLNLTMVDFEIARRVLDFAMGSIYALDGAYQKITDTIFLFVPNGIDISGAFNGENSEESEQ